MYKKFLHYDVRANGRDAIEVTLNGNAANVLLLDDSNYRRYQSGEPFRGYGGFYKRSPAVLQVPGPGSWHVVIDLGGGAGRVSASVRVLTRA